MVVADYRSAYGGNFIPSLIALEDSDGYRDYDFLYVFPKEAKNAWVSALCEQKRDIVFVDFNSGHKSLYKELTKLIHDYKVNVLYFHFSHFLLLS